MPRPKTECTELAVGFGILGRDPKKVDPGEVENLFSGTLTQKKFRAFLSEYDKSELYQELFYLGNEIRNKYEPFRNISSLKWRGPDRMSPSVSSSQDLLVLGCMPVSVKVGSDVVYNLSPVNLFEKLPLQESFIKRGDNWFLRYAKPEMQALYDLVKDRVPHLPDSVEEFEECATPTDREKIQAAIADLSGDIKGAFDEKYMEMCHKVARLSAELFNKRYMETSKTNKRIALVESIGKVFFRLNSIPYLLVGIEREERLKFAVIVPDITDWRREWVLQGLRAYADENRKQCVVNFEFKCRKKNEKGVKTLTFHAEIRWSHGKFCGNPEAKLYKEFKWLEVPFFDVVYPCGPASPPENV